MKLKNLLTKKFIIAAAIAVAVLGIGSSVLFRKKASPELITATRGDITERIIATGKITPAENLSLAFENGGKISSVNADVGKKVRVGEIIVQLDQGELLAQLEQAKANVAAEEAVLESLKIGSRPEDIQIAQTNLRKAEQDLTNYYHNTVTILNDSYVKANDAVINQTDDAFLNDNTETPQLTYQTNDFQSKYDSQALRFSAGAELAAWRSELAALNPSNKTELEIANAKAKTHLTVVRAFLSRLFDTLIATNSLTPTILATYKANIISGLSQVNSALTNIDGVGNSIATQKVVVQQLNDELKLKLAGSTKENIDAQEAKLLQAKANASVTENKLKQTYILSPINGTIAKQDAKKGQIAAANSPLVSIISEDKLEIDANIPEVDVVKISIGDKVDMNFDALQGEKFSGRVISIDPAETVIDGAVNFKVKMVLDANDQRLKSGLTANLSIETAKKTGAVILPQVGIVENDKGAFVKKYENGQFKEYPIKLGIRNQNGNVEIVSGLNEGDQVMNVGKKTAQ